MHCCSKYLFFQVHATFTAEMHMYLRMCAYATVQQPTLPSKLRQTRICLYLVCLLILLFLQMCEFDYMPSGGLLLW